MLAPNSAVLGYLPRNQFAEYHYRPQRWSCIVTHVRAGKTVACLMDLVDKALRCQKKEPRFAYVAPYYAQAKDVAWTYLKRFTADIPGAVSHEQELKIDFPNGGRVRLYGADNYNRMRGIYLDGVVLDEFAEFHPAAWQEVIRQRLSDRQGWATFIGTPKGRNAFYDKWIEATVKDKDNWFSMMLRSSETGILSKEELTDARKAMTPEQFDQEYECSFDAAILGAYYGREMAKLEQAKRIRSVPYDPALPVYTAWDLGVHDATSIWFVQCAGSEVRVIDHYETHEGLTVSAKVLRSEKPYVYAEHYWPHDGEVREIMTAKSRKEHMESLGIKPIVIVPLQRLEDGINAVRNILPRCVFDGQSCAMGIEALKQYRHEWDDKLKVFRNKALHDWTSHAADAFRYLATSLAPKIERQSSRRGARIGHLVT